MPANTDPIFARTSDLQMAGAIIGPTAVTATDGTGALSLIATLDVTEGDFVAKVILKPIGSIAATVARLFWCRDTGATFTPGTTNTASNTALIGEVAIAAWTASNTAASPVYEIPVNIPFPVGGTTGHKLLMGFGTSTGAAGNGFNPVTVAGKY